MKININGVSVFNFTEASAPSQSFQPPPTIIDNVVTLGSYIHDLKTEGFWLATFDKTPYELFILPLYHAFKVSLEFLIVNDEAFLIIPAIVIMFATFFIGRNKYSKWIIPLWFLYFALSIITNTTGLLSWLSK